MNRKRILLFSLGVLLMTCLGLTTVQWFHQRIGNKMPPVKAKVRAIHDTVQKGETLLAIFEKYGLDMKELFAMRQVALNVHPLRSLHPGQAYTLNVDCQSRVSSFVYWINRDSYLQIKRIATGFHAEKSELAYAKKFLTLSGAIEDNLISSIGDDREHLLLALDLSDIFAWDIDFTSDLRKGDTFRIITEGYYYNGQFRKYGNIVAAEFTNNGELFKAYRFEHDGKTAYYDEDGNARKKAFLKAPLNFRRISSYFSKGRFHPVLKIYRPHHGLDYAAAKGTPVSAIGDGKVMFSGRKGAYGNLIIIKHPNGWQTYYGHLSRIAKGIRPGRSVEQGQTIGNVGATGLATGPHLHYEVRVGGRSMNPLTMKIPKGWPVSHKQMAAFCSIRDRMDGHFAAMGTCEVPARPERTIIKTGYHPDGKSVTTRVSASRSASNL